MTCLILDDRATEGEQQHMPNEMSRPDGCGEKLQTLFVTDRFN